MELARIIQTGWKRFSSISPDRLGPVGLRLAEPRSLETSSGNRQILPSCGVESASTDSSAFRRAHRGTAPSRCGRLRSRSQGAARTREPTVVAGMGRRGDSFDDSICSRSDRSLDQRFGPAVGLNGSRSIRAKAERHRRHDRRSGLWRPFRPRKSSPQDAQHGLVVFAERPVHRFSRCAHVYSHPRPTRNWARRDRQRCLVRVHGPVVDPRGTAHDGRHLPGRRVRDRALRQVALGRQLPVSSARPLLSRGRASRGLGITSLADYIGNDYFNDHYRHNGRIEQYTGYCTGV